MKDIPSLVLLTEVHRWRGGLCLDHQLVLLPPGLPAASACLTDRASNLRLHIEDEAVSPIPLYHARTEQVSGGAVELFTGEHT
jgi:hypothetical protein